MAKACCVLGCSSRFSSHPGSTRSLFHFPKSDALLKKWIKFLSKHQKWSGPSPHSRICSLHFNKDDFENWMKYHMGHTRRLILKKDVVPSILPKAVAFQRRPDVSLRDKRMMIRDIKKDSIRLKGVVKVNGLPTGTKSLFRISPPSSDQERGYRSIGTDTTGLKQCRDFTCQFGVSYLSVNVDLTKLSKSVRDFENSAQVEADGS